MDHLLSGHPKLRAPPSIAQLFKSHFVDFQSVGKGIYSIPVSKITGVFAPSKTRLPDHREEGQPLVCCYLPDLFEEVLDDPLLGHVRANGEPVLQLALYLTDVLLVLLCSEPISTYTQTTYCTAFSYIFKLLIIFLSLQYNFFNFYSE